MAAGMDHSMWACNFFHKSIFWTKTRTFCEKLYMYYTNECSEQYYRYMCICIYLTSHVIFTLYILKWGQPCMIWRVLKCE